MLCRRVDDGWGQEVCRADVGEGPRLGKLGLDPAKLQERELRLKGRNVV